MHFAYLDVLVTHVTHVTHRLFDCLGRQIPHPQAWAADGLLQSESGRASISVLRPFQFYCCCMVDMSWYMLVFVGYFFI